ncbi:hypothetical protein [Sulfuracidifex tepidarius]|uniref:hypothetical protein n=1 Tax=Sulfuracidifex tepidarius TaxID=1294262 RepID=UPI0011F1ADAB|nr:hypothetical protein [Sulfuracidifex tepidarius]
MGTLSLMSKHKYGSAGTLTLVEISFILASSLVIAFNLDFPYTREVMGGKEVSFMNFMITFVTAMFSIIPVRNASFGMSQDISDGTFMTFVQMEGKFKAFIYAYLMDVLYPISIFLVVGTLVLTLATLNYLWWAVESLTGYMFVANLSYTSSLVLRKTFRTFIGSVLSIFIYLAIIFLDLGSIALLAVIDVLLLSFLLYKFRCIEI